ncbi:hypothetical protein QZH41_020126 [Actinostola sp. cb2023]|nr:hypothetical protein QZH41_020126 [Actinostola sp. cb2023]
MAADLSKLNKKAITNLQAHVRGALVRSKLNEVQKQFEDIVHQLDGAEFAVLWHSKTLSIPFVTNKTENPERELFS